MDLRPGLAISDNHPPVGESEDIAVYAFPYLDESMLSVQGLRRDACDQRRPNAFIRQSWKIDYQIRNSAKHGDPKDVWKVRHWEEARAIPALNLTLASGFDLHKFLLIRYFSDFAEQKNSLLTSFT